MFMMTPLYIHIKCLEQGLVLEDKGLLTIFLGNSKPQRCSDVLLSAVARHKIELAFRKYLLNEVNMLRERGRVVPWTEGGNEQHPG